MVCDNSSNSSYITSNQFQDVDTPCPPCTLPPRPPQPPRPPRPGPDTDEQPPILNNQYNPGRPNIVQPNISLCRAPIFPLSVAMLPPIFECDRVEMPYSHYTELNPLLKFRQYTNSQYAFIGTLIIEEATHNFQTVRETLLSEYNKGRISMTEYARALVDWNMFELQALQYMETIVRVSEEAFVTKCKVAGVA